MKACVAPECRKNEFTRLFPNFPLPARDNCSIFGGRRYQLEVRLCHSFPALLPKPGQFGLFRRSAPPA